jgi:hypothetical protein
MMAITTENDTWLFHARKWVARKICDTISPKGIGEGLRVMAERKAVKDALERNSSPLALARAMLAYDFHTSTGHIQDENGFRHLTEAEALQIAEAATLFAGSYSGHLGAKERRAILARQ